MSQRTESYLVPPEFIGELRELLDRVRTSHGGTIRDDIESALSRLDRLLAIPDSTVDGIEARYYVHAKDRAHWPHVAWWAPQRAGYTNDLREAGRYTAEECQRIEAQTPGEQVYVMCFDAHSQAIEALPKDRMPPTKSKGPFPALSKDNLEWLASSPADVARRAGRPGSPVVAPGPSPSEGPSGSEWARRFAEVGLRFSEGSVEIDAEGGFVTLGEDLELYWGTDPDRHGRRKLTYSQACVLAEWMASRKAAS